MKFLPNFLKLICTAVLSGNDNDRNSSSVDPASARYAINSGLSGRAIETIINNLNSNYFELVDNIIFITVYHSSFIINKSNQVILV